MHADVAATNLRLAELIKEKLRGAQTAGGSRGQLINSDEKSVSVFTWFHFIFLSYQLFLSEKFDAEPVGAGVVYY